MSALRLVGLSTALVVGFAMASPLHAAPSGTVIAVIQQAEADGVTGRLVLQPESPIFSGDRIETGAVGEAQIRFLDNTRLVVGPKSSMVIDAFVFDDAAGGGISINALRGAFRFITGDSAKDAYSITTPTATIGVRGTEFDVNVEAGTGVTRVANFAGITRICRRDTSDIVDPNDPERHLPRCIETQNPCGVSVVAPARGIREFVDQRDRNRELAWYFRYVRDQSGLLSDFRVSTERCGDLSLPPPTPIRSDPPRPASPS